MSEHMAEPWRSRGLRVLAGDGDEAFVVANTWSGTFAPTREIAAANARRLAACVNACAGIATEDLESVGRLEDQRERNHEFAVMESERDGLAFKVSDLSEMVTNLEARIASLRQPLEYFVDYAGAFTESGWRDVWQKWEAVYRGKGEALDAARKALAETAAKEGT